MLRVAMSAMLPKAAAAVARRRVRYGPMLLKKVFRRVEQIFSEIPVRSSENDVGGNIVSPISSQQPS
jgi:hypothetical protein